MKRMLSVAGMLAMALCAAPAAAHVHIYTTALSGPAEHPANASPGTGFARVTVDLDLATMRVEASFSGLTGNVTASHIHCCVDPGAPTPTAGVATPTPSFPGFPHGGTSGTYDMTFDLGQASSYRDGFITSNGGSVSGAMNALLAGLDAGQAYLNIHTTTFGGGEIRGFLQPVPEPETYALMLAGLGLVGFAARRRLQGR